MTALPVSDFARDVGIDYSRDSASSAVRGKARSDEARDRAEPNDARAERFSDFDKALRDQDVDEPVRSRQERAPERISDRPKEIAANDATVVEAPVADARVESKSAPKLDAAKAKPAGEQPEPQAAGKPSVILPDVVQVVSAAAPKAGSLKPDALGALETDTKMDSADGHAPDACAVTPALIVPNAAAQTGAQNLLAALAAGAPAAQQPQQHAAAPADTGAAAPAADPLATLNAAQAGLKTDAPAQGSAPQPTAQASAAPPAAVTSPNAAVEAAAAATIAAPEAKPRQASDQNVKSADAPTPGPAAPPAAAAQQAAQPVAILQGAVKATVQGAKDAKAADVQIADLKPAAPAQPSSFGAQLDAQSAQTATHASAATPGQASPNSTAIAHNVVRFFRETGSGSARFDIRLDPVELGRVDARVEINHDKTVTLTLSAERPDTLAELMRTARDLERQLTDSGVKLSDDGLKFRLNSDARGDAQQNMQSGPDGRRSGRSAYGAGVDPALQAEAAIPTRSWRASGVDVWA